MPIEIRELVIKASVVKPVQPFPADQLVTQSDMNYFKKEIIEECIAKMEKLLAKKSRR